jgi:hypothetical protein
MGAVSVEAVFKVRYKNHEYDVEECYNPGKSVAGVKELIVAKLNCLRAFQPPAGPIAFLVALQYAPVNCSFYSLHLCCDAAGSTGYCHYRY